MRLRLLVAATIAGLATLAPHAGAAQQQGSTGVLVYARGTSDPGDFTPPTIFVAAADGTGERAYTTGYFPAVSRGGEARIAYSVRTGGAFQLVVARLDDSAPPRQLTTLPDREGEFGQGRYGVAGSVWSPSGSRIAVRLVEGSTTTLGIVDAESGDLKRLDFGHLFGSTIAWRDDESLVVGTDEGLRLVGADGTASPVPGGAQGDTPALWQDDNTLVVNDAAGITLLDVTSGTRTPMPLIPGGRAWESYLSVGVLYTDATNVGLFTPGDGPGTSPSVLDTLPGGTVRNGIGARDAPILEIATGAAVSDIWVARLQVNLGSAPAGVAMERIATGSDLTFNERIGVGDVVAQGETPAVTDPQPGPVVVDPPPGRPGTLAAAPGPVDPPEGRSAFAHALPAADEVSTDAKALLVNALVTALLMLLITFPSELFNNTLEEHYDEVRGWFGRHGPRPEPVQRTRQQRALMFAGYASAAAVLYTLLDKEAGLDGTTLRLWLGLLVGIVVVTFTFSAASLLFHKKRGSAGVLNVLPGTLLVAIACVLITRLTKFEPGYVYGVVGGFAFATALPEREEGRAAALSAAWVFAAALLAWLVWLPVNDAAESGSPGLFLGLADTTLSAIAVGGVQGLVIGLLPLKSLPGHTIARWDRRVWGAIYGVVLFVFIHLLLHPSSGFGAESHPNAFFTWLALFVGFGVVSVAFWGYFQRRPEPASSG